MIVILRIAVFVILALGIVAAPGLAQERPYFVTYDHHMEEPGNLEVATNPVIGRHGVSTRSSVIGPNSSTEPKAGGRRSSISTASTRCMITLC